MAPIRGSFADGAPVVTITVRSASHAVPRSAVIDTGFDGFSAIPASLASMLGLRPDIAVEVEYADGHVGNVALASAHVVLAGEAREALIHVHPHSHETLVGLDFLRAFGKVLVLSVSHETVTLVDRPR